MERQAPVRHGLHREADDAAGMVPARPDPQARRVRPFHDDAREPSEKFGRRREKDASKRRKNKVRFEDFEDEDY